MKNKVLIASNWYSGALVRGKFMKLDYSHVEYVCRHLYCWNQAKVGMNPKALQYLMGHSNIAVTINVYIHVGLEDAKNKLRKMQSLEGARKEMWISDKDDNPLKQNMFKVV